MDILTFLSVFFSDIFHNFFIDDFYEFEEVPFCLFPDHFLKTMNGFWIFVKFFSWIEILIPFCFLKVLISFNYIDQLTNVNQPYWHKLYLVIDVLSLLYVDGFNLMPFC